MAWARFYLVRAGLVGNELRGVWTLTDRGRAQVGLTHEQAISLFASIHASFRLPVEDQAGTQDDAVVSDDTGAPADTDLETLPREHGQDHRANFLAHLGRISPAAFERFSQRLLRVVGFETVDVTGRSGDGGIDGIGLLQVNRLLSIRTLFQCKRFSGPVSSPVVRDFRGAMAGRSDYGIILTTSTFTQDARREASRDGVPAIELVDGDRIVALCEEFNLGLRTRTIFEVDPGFFETL